MSEYQLTMSVADVRAELAWLLQELNDAANSSAELDTVTRRVARIVADIDRGALGEEGGDHAN